MGNSSTVFCVFCETEVPLGKYCVECGSKLCYYICPKSKECMLTEYDCDHKIPHKHKTSCDEDICKKDSDKHRTGVCCILKNFNDLTKR